jgi:hypothetical protein
VVVSANCLLIGDRRHGRVGDHGSVQHNLVSGLAQTAQHYLWLTSVSVGLE